MLAVTGMILGLDVATGGGIADALSVALMPLGASQGAGNDDRSTEWRRLRAAAVGPRGQEIREIARQALLRRLGRTQGRGENIVALDLAEVVGELRRVCREWTPPQPAGDASPD